MDVCLKEAGPWEGWRGDPDAAQNSIAECEKPHLQAANPGRSVAASPSLRVELQGVEIYHRFPFLLC